MLAEETVGEEREEWGQLEVVLEGRMCPPGPFSLLVMYVPVLFLRSLRYEECAT